ncbi:hypothetical protein UCDDA912_g10800 [Diaporthe ampelina]|uniref:Uncharacterized protein n=1 Tax=Diaporthe ampelina TaxID=1214573 RepID=A0A0G2H1T5_9PEZI|nr:hypothetical protein UCDDA912_g10800 [Diaporthe ampelina]
MLLKRKRSDHELSPFSSSSPLRASVAGDVPTLDMDVDMDMNLDTHVDMGIDRPLSAMTIRSPSRSCTLSHLPGRTFKRLRNGRPSDHEVHRKSGNGAASPPQGPFLSWEAAPAATAYLLTAARRQALYRAIARVLRTTSLTCGTRAGAEPALLAQLLEHPF